MHYTIAVSEHYKVNVRADRHIEQVVNQEWAFWGKLINAENIGKTSDDLAGQWNIDHPDDPVEN